MSKDCLKGTLIDKNVIVELNDASRELNNKNCFGNITSKTLQLSMLEALYLLEKKKLIIYDKRNKEIVYEQFLKKTKKLTHNFLTIYSVFKDFRGRGYIIKSALKFGAEFSVYDRGIKPGEDHAKWLVFPVHESEILTWYEFSAKNRVAHSTRKRLLIAVVDNEGSITYYEIAWKRP